MSIRQLSPKLQKTAQKEINEDPNKVNEYLKDIDEWLKTQPHLNVRKDPQFLLTFLRYCKFNLQQTKERLDFYHTIKCFTPEYLMDRNVNTREIRKIFDKGQIIPLTKITEVEGLPTIILVKWSNRNSKIEHYTDFLKLCLMCMEVTLNEYDSSMINGVDVVVDMEEFSLEYLKQLTPLLCKKLVVVLQSAFPLRIKNYCFINSPPAYDVYLEMFTPFFNAEFTNKLKVFRKEAIGEFYKLVPLTVFPEEYGGKAGPTSKIIAEFNATLEKYKNWFIDDAKYCSDESKRPGKPKTAVDIFGMEECRERLNID